jgi:membrane protease subunit HflC
MRNGIILFTLVVLVIVGKDAFYVLPEGQQALVTEFGQIQGEPITNAGLHFKKPFVNDVRYFEKRILAWDGDDNRAPTKDKKFIYVDTTARWKISDLRKFAETVIDERGARDRLNSIIDGATRDVIASYNLVEAVRNSNAAIERQKELQQNAEDLKAAENNLTTSAFADEASGDIEKVTQGRDKLSQIIAKRASADLPRFGIELIDVQLRRIAYDQSVEAKVYDRMISERKRIAEKIRSIGKGEDANIRGNLNRDLKSIESDAYRQSQAIRGKAEAEAIAIYAKALNKDPSYYKFIKTLEVYRNTLPSTKQMILSTDSEFLKLMKKP